MSSPPILEAHNVVKRFHAGGRAVHAVDDVSLTVAEGETLGLVGESGCGKSTTARLLCRLLDVTAGTVLFRGQDVTHARPRQLRALRREVQMVFQDPYSSLNPRKSIGAIVGVPLKVHGIEPNAARRRERVQELMAQVGLNPEHYNRFPHEFSGGQRQRIGIARALALDPKVIVADEPVSALDVSIQAQILNLLKDLQASLGLTIVLIAHDLSVVRHMCDRVAVMHLGKIAEIAPAPELFAGPRHPYTGALLSSVPVPRPRSAERLGRVVLAGDLPSPSDPPSGCRFHTRCPKAQERCSVEDPPLAPQPGHGVACHFPLADGELLAWRGGAQPTRAARS